MEARVQQLRRRASMNKAAKRGTETGAAVAALAAAGAAAAVQVEPWVGAVMGKEQQQTLVLVAGY